MSLKKKLLSCLTSAISMPWLTEVEYLKTNYLYSSGAAPIIQTDLYNNWDLPLEITATIAITGTNRCVIIGNYSNSLTCILEMTAERRLRFYASNSTNIDPTYETVSFVVTERIPLDTPTKIWVKCNPLNDSAHTINCELGFETLDGSNVKGKLTDTFYRSGTVGSSRPMRLFFDYRTIASAFDGGFKMYQLEYKNGINHRKFIPCLDLNRKTAMYEQVEGKIYNNAGTGEFSAGRRITEVEWINLTGTQYFNTGFKPNTLTTTLKTKFTFEGTAMMMGCRNTSASYNEMCSIYIPTPTTTRPFSRARLDWMSGSGSIFSSNFESEVVELEITGNYAKVNGVEYTDTTKTSIDMTVPFYIGGAYTANSSAINYAMTGKVYYASLLNTTTREVYRYGVPAHDENNVGFFFDRTNHFIMDNAGSNTQDMTWGDEIHPVSYLYGGAPSRFNTGIVFYDHAWETDVKYNSVRSEMNLMGTTTGACNYWGVYESDSQYAKTYTLHSTSPNYGLTIDPAELRTVFLDMGLDTDNTTYKLTMTVEGESVYRTASSVNTTTGYRVTNFANGYPEPAYLYGNRCYNRTTKELIQNLIPVQNGQKSAFLLNILNHTIINPISNIDEFIKGSDVVGYTTNPQLPYGLMEVDYLESTGEQYINTGINMTPDYGVEIEAKQTATTTGASRYLFGVSSDGKRYMIALASGTDCYLLDLESSTYRLNTSVNAYDGKFHTHKVENRTYYIDGVSQGTSTSTGTFTTSVSAFLFGVIGIARTNCYWQIRKAKIFNENGRIIANYVPCLRTYDNKPGMFDLVNRQFLTNQGTGEFIFSLNGVRYAALNYLESTGTQYIDTGIYMKSTYGVEIDAKQTSAVQGSGRYLFGDAPATYKRYLILVTAGGNTYRFGLDNLNKDSNVSAYDNQFHIHKVDNKTYYIDGVSQGNIAVDDFACDRPARLFSVYTSSSLTNNYWQIRSFKVKDEDGRIIANYIPALRQTDSKPGMLDLATGTFFVNSGTGEFTYG